MSSATASAVEVPHDEAAEQSVLGAMMLSAEVVEKVLSRLRPEDFYSASHRRVFEAIVQLHGRGVRPDQVTVKDELARLGTLNEAGGALGVHGLVESVPVPESAGHYAGIVAEKAEGRQLLEEMGQGIRRLQAGESPDAIRSELVRFEPTERTSAMHPRLVGGWSFTRDQSVDAEPVWGSAREILWSPGEPVLLVGPQGVGKTTLAQRVALARIGLRPSPILGFPVDVADEPVLYVAADRPVQAARSLRRMVRDEDADVLEDQLKVWWGPPPFDLGADPRRFVPWVRGFGVKTVFLDALKNVAMGISKDEAGSGLSSALNDAVAEGIEVFATHHQRKGQKDNPRPKTLDDVYGSNWITAGSGSVVLLWGNAGDPVVELSHLKQPAEPVGPFQILIDHPAGAMEVMEGTDLLGILRNAKKGLAAQDGARLLFGTQDPSDAETEKARRKLNGLVRRGVAHRVDGSPVMYVATDPARLVQ